MLRWRIFGINFCIQPSFWFMNALWALLMAGPLSQNRVDNRGILIFIAIWIACSLVSVMVHELGHVIVGRIFGQPGNITISGLGGQAVGSYDALRPWQRILVIMAGPGAGFAFVALLVCLDSDPWNMFMDYLTDVTAKEFWLDCKVRLFWIDKTPLAGWHQARSFPYIIAVNLLTFVNLFVNIMNLLPIIPMDGGMIFKEICCLIFPRAGLKIAFGWSFLLACAVSVFYLVLTLEKYDLLTPKRLEPYYPFGFPEFSLIVFISLAYQCFQVYRQLLMRERHEAYMDDDDMSGPRRLPAGVEEVPVKDPDDFAPRAPGSERPRR
jgi:stage IV sporulation protein FB